MRIPRRVQAAAVVATAVLVGLTACKSNGLPPTPGSYVPTTSASTTPAVSGAAFSHGTTVKDVLTAAKAALTKIGTFSYQHFDDDINATVADLTPSFGATYRSRTASLKQTIVSLKNVSTASGVVAGIATLDSSLESATVVGEFTQSLTGVTQTSKKVSKTVAVVGLLEINKRWLVNNLTVPPGGPPAVGSPSLGSPDLVKALAAGESEIAALGTLRKGHFTADYTKWLDASTGALHSKLAKAEKSTKSAFAQSGAALSTVCKAAGIESASSTKVDLLVYVTATGRKTTNSLSRMTLEKVNGHWLASAVKLL